MGVCATKNQADADLSGAGQTVTSAAAFPPLSAAASPHPLTSPPTSHQVSFQLDTESLSEVVVHESLSPAGDEQGLGSLSEPRGTSLELSGTTTPRGKNVLVRGKSAQMRRQPSSGTDTLLNQPRAGRRWHTFTPAVPTLSAEARQHARETLRAALSEHFMFRHLTAAQLDATVGQMRHRLVRAGYVVTAQGVANAPRSLLHHQGEQHTVPFPMSVRMSTTYTPPSHGARRTHIHAHRHTHTHTHSQSTHPTHLHSQTASLTPGHPCSQPRSTRETGTC